MLRTARGRGFTLIEAMLVISILVGVMSGLARLGLRWSERETARLAGVEYASFVHAVRTYLGYDLEGAELPTALPLGDINRRGDYSELTGVYWLQHSTCSAGTPPGIATRHYLPCSFSGKGLFDPAADGTPPADPRAQRLRTHYTTTIDRNFTPYRVIIRLAAIELTAGERRDDLAGIIARTATTRWMAPDVGGFSPYTIRVDTVSGDIIADISPGSLHEPYLRRDGSNTMHGHLRFDTDVDGSVRYDITGIRNADLSELAVDRSVAIGNVPEGGDAPSYVSEDAKGGILLGRGADGERGAIHLYSTKSPTGIELSGYPDSEFGDGLQDAYVHIDTRVVAHNTLLNKPNCNRDNNITAKARIQLSIHRFVPADPNGTIWFNMRADDSPGDQWRINFQGPLQDSEKPYTALASIYCDYNY